jgi:polysaccharide export outer membrane protein
MKKPATKLSIALIILGLISCVSPRGIHLINLSTKDLPSETELILTTSEPVKYTHTKLDDPPCILINFPEDKVFSIEEDELIINKGAIKKIRNEYFKGTGNSPRHLNLMIVELTHDFPYKVANSGSSIIIRIENSGKSQSKGSKEKTKIDLPLQVQDNNPSTPFGYMIGPGDVLYIEVWKQEDISRQVTVNYKGEIRLPPIKTVSAIGLNAPQLEEKLTKALSKYLIEPIVFVTVREYNSQRVIALGEIATGMYTLKRKTTLIEFLGQIGGPNDDADTANIRLIRKDGKIFTYDLNELINNPQQSDKTVVSGGDTVYVPPLAINKVYVLGEVSEPKVITLKGKMTLVDAITEAGGYTRDAVTKSIVVIRGELGSQQGIRVNLKRILKQGDVGQNIELKPGDIVYVPKSFIVDIERFLRDIALPVTWYFWYLR